MRDLAQVLMEYYRFWYHDQINATSQVRSIDPPIELNPRSIS